MKKKTVILLTLGIIYAVLIGIVTPVVTTISAVNFITSYVDFRATSGLEYTLSSDGKSYTVTGIGTATEQEIIIAARYNGLPVKSVGRYAFKNCDNLKRIEIPEGVTGIEQCAFIECDNLETVIIPSSIMNVASSVFTDSNSLTYEEYDNAYYLGNAKNKYLMLIKAKSEDITTCNVNAATKFIYDGAFFNCNQLTSIEIPSGVTTIGAYAFTDCTNLNNVEIPDTITKIGDKAFFGCSNLQYNVFEDANYLGNSDNPYVVLLKIINREKTTYNINSGVKVVYYEAFSNCRQMTNLELPEGLRSISNSSFFFCIELTTVVIPASVTHIGYNAFYTCTALTSVTFKNASGWYAAKFEAEPSGTDMDLTDPSQNAIYLKNEYAGHYWYCYK